MKNLISMRDLTTKEIMHLMEVAAKIENGDIVPDMQRKLAALLFFEPSTRTMFSFDTAMKRMNGDTIIMSGTKNTSAKKGESFADTLQTIAQYSDIIIMRSPIEGSARYASEVVDIPVVNAGDGANQHPTQALLDLYSIIKTQGSLENLSIGLAGDLRFGRTVHSLAQAMAMFGANFKFFSPSFLQMPQYIKDDLKNSGIKFKEYKDMDGNISDLDILYVTRIQKERFADPEDYEKVKGSYILEKSMLSDVKENFKVMHPLPRVDEINKDVDNTKFAYYFPQAKNGVFTRQAIISMLLGEV
ncbi:MAG: aspartate carbamoyltransferase [Candidatus Cloacimonetes bacterium]|nr:aspartate carbamoyltransferase [Candidatus Cloacimonadota bacterium]MCF7812887.1 aspartate carbamoyltransferase [Candidatus Cloacimonadota bacterium]MCF7867099.1 aspartate carbamoyltransferase [Candidatus Cloacimonadota bacterium]MCF7882581.1 aspartate carbamoyltransferase [Candidatus Cloacimonadota bacterium]